MALPMSVPEGVLTTAGGKVVAAGEWWPHSTVVRGEPEPPPPAPPFVRRPPACGRNEPCPCGSGRKYKRCCNPKR
jgi:uncharacterized protein YecA (UPF0149 family)